MVHFVKLLYLICVNRSGLHCLRLAVALRQRGLDAVWSDGNQGRRLCMGRRRPPRWQEHRPTRRSPVRLLLCTFAGACHSPATVGKGNGCLVGCH
eukprot:XP_001703588.1 predicted protein [Chlamydomonas reinhardtii]